MPSALRAAGVPLYARTRASQPWLDARRSNGRDFSLQPHLGLVRPAMWLPSPAANAGRERGGDKPGRRHGAHRRVRHALGGDGRARRLTSAATADSASDQRSRVFTCWRGNAAGLDGWTFVTQISLSTLQATGMAFFALYDSTAALTTTLALSAVVSCTGKFISLREV